MELDALRAQWADQYARLEAGLVLNRRLLLAQHLDRTRTALQRHARGLTVEAAVNLVAVAWLGTFLYSHLAQPGYFAPALVLDVFAVAIVVDLVRQIEFARGIDHGQPVAALQKRLEQLRVLRIRHVKGVFIIAPLVWILIFVVAVKALFGIDAWRTVSAAWLAGNMLLGVAVIPISILLSRRFADRMQRLPWIQRLMDDIAGKNLSQARAFLAEISEFEHAAPSD